MSDKQVDEFGYDARTDTIFIRRGKTRREYRGTNTRCWRLLDATIAKVKREQGWHLDEPPQRMGR